jgi:hypothetical protein
MAVYGFTSKPESTEAMLLLAEGFGHHTETLDLIDFHDWLSEHRPDLLVADRKPGRNFDPYCMETEVLAQVLAYARTKYRERHPLQAFELGHLVDANHAYMDYAKAGTWQQGAGAGVGIVEEGRLRVKTVKPSKKH